MTEAKRFRCPCCGFLTLHEQPPGTFDICPVCDWEDDNVQFDDPSFEGGANRVSLEQARHNFRTFGASSADGLGRVRDPMPVERPDFDRVKIRVDLAQDVDGYPPAAIEGLWAEPVGEMLFKIDNIPFFATGLAVDDVVEAAREGDGLVLDHVVSPSGHSTLRVVFFDEALVPIVRAELDARGCPSELSHIPSLIAVDVPPEVDLRAITAYLDARSSVGELDYEESAVGHTR